ncbi:MAG: chromophore lyase CpcT/CpeT [Myxococcota bacterium]
MTRLLLLGLGWACTPQEAPPAEVDLAQTLNDFLVGEFDSSAQADRNPEYFSIQLLTCEVSAPELGDLVVYVEQAVLETADQPYRQRLYVIEDDAEDPTRAFTKVFTLNDETAAIGLCGSETRPTFARADVELRTGCGVDVTWNDKEQTFSGGTTGQRCSSSLSGASYATSEVTIREDRVDSWDRGYDESGTQVWGAVAGPYRFRRR